MVENNGNNDRKRNKAFAEQLAYAGEIKIPDWGGKEIQLIDIRRSTYEPERMEHGRKNSERYQGRKTTRSKRVKAASRKAIAMGLGAVVLFGGFKAYTEYKDSQNTLTLEQALENGETLKGLGIDEDIAIKIEELSTLLESDLTNQKLIEIAEETPEIEEKVIKTKIANSIEDVDWNDIILNPVTYTKDDLTLMRIQGGERYSRKDITSGFMGEKTVSAEIANYIDRIVKSQKKRETMQKEDINRNQAINYYRRELKEISKFAAGKIEIDEKGNISIEKTRISELEKEKAEEIVKNDEGFEIGD